MKKSEPKMILNVQIDNQELEEKVKVAMDRYAENLILKNLDDKIQKIVNLRIERLIKGDSWTDDGKIAGKPLSSYVREKSERVIEEVIEKNVKDILTKKIADMI